MRCYVFDIDGTLADVRHRLHHIQKEPKDWDAFFDACDQDKPIVPVCEIAALVSCSVYATVFVSGRSDRVRKKTLDWLHVNVGFSHDVGMNSLYMRADGDHRPDNLVKKDLLDQMRADGFDPIMAFDDRDQVVKMWRAAGVPCAQVAEGNF